MKVKDRLKKRLKKIIVILAVLSIGFFILISAAVVSSVTGLVSGNASEQQSQNVEDLVDEDTVYTGGEFAWPVPSVGPSNITSLYGWRIHPIFGVGRGHTGIDIGAGYGSRVIAAKDGKVIMASWFGGYGNTVMVDHGGGVVTLYGHNSRFNCHTGQLVKRGDTIAFIGSTGNSTGPHCHFEIRVNGSTIDPFDYIVKE